MRQSSFCFDWRSMALDGCRHSHRRAGRKTQRRQKHARQRKESHAEGTDIKQEAAGEALQYRRIRTMAATRDDQRASCTKRASEAIRRVASPPQPLARSIRKTWRPASTTTGAGRTAPGEPYGTSPFIAANPCVIGQAPPRSKTSSATTWNTGHSATCRKSEPAASMHMG